MKRYVAHVLSERADPLFNHTGPTGARLAEAKP